MQIYTCIIMYTPNHTNHVMRIQTSIKACVFSPSKTNPPKIPPAPGSRLRESGPGEFFHKGLLLGAGWKQQQISVFI